ncbi:shikimate kinase, partial [Streptomyces sp. NPDC059744]|uniref:shikimate kinase n=1 Tax=Streptomyces sp. NPDC059744 TaxID=3346929 RepID=UPI003653AB61
MSGPLIVLVGPMGVGKSTVGELLADRLGTTYRDTDADVVATAGKPISEIFYDEGEEHFRELEREAVRAAGGAASAGPRRWTNRLCVINNRRSPPEWGCVYRWGPG